MVFLMINVKTLMLLAIVCVIAVSCARFFSKGASNAQLLTAFSNVNADEFQTLIADPNVQLLDVRTQEEFDEGRIAGATLVDANDSDFVQKAMAVYCRSGRRSARAAMQLCEQGYHVTNLSGGVIAWQDAGKALIK